ncbi:efflux RND transporter permease subunit [Prosthecobacter vanneervenii]|uniref:HAE1 family hydrophobic/amphiphilic exporter-1 n=1 Tax=Prosthecobacter vanneervenii TaxID=48466 RepID=A0A7W7Y6Q7_9BACT|nr:efflux RND transporter permease subunit [Prosthecobacter vanneervenii]MBB5030628.1 HAE1 family hydrophobic/amphiphilic exporter-1 [Prosthecobacter vanneervenii]
MFSKVLQRPALAIVISLLILFLGALSIFRLPISQFPNVAPVVVMVNITYPGASAKVLEESVLVLLDQAINGVQDMKYMMSDATSAGEATIQVVFHLGTDPKDATVNVLNRVNQVKNQLPPLVQREGIIVNNVSPNMLMYVNLFSTDKAADMQLLFNYAYVQIQPQLARIRGVGQVRILGTRNYAMRIWLKPDRMRAYNVSTEDVMKALEEQSVIGTPGRLGRADSRRSQALEYVLTYQGRYNTAEQYEKVILRATEKGEILKLKDVADVELGSEFYDLYSDLDGHPSAAIVIKQSYNSNANEVIKLIKAQLKEIKRKNFPAGMDYEISYDVSEFLDASIDKVLHTLVEAFILVAMVVFIFLGDWRSTLIPTLAVPVSLVGAFFLMQLFGVSINLITLFALVLAIGIVVDDPIVVVEAVHARMHGTSLTPYEAIQKVLLEIAGAVIAITLVMTAVFVPVTFMSGPVGVFYRQFAITMASAIILSGVMALTLTPVLCAMILRRHDHHPGQRSGPVAWLLGHFNRLFDRLTSVYVELLKKIVHRRAFTLGMLGLAGTAIYIVNSQLSPGFIPAEDQGMIYAILQTPPGSTLERTYDKSLELEKIAKKVPGVQSVSSLAGYEVLTEGRGSNAGTCLINLKNWSERKLNSKQIIAELEKRCRVISGVKLEFYEPPAVPGYGAAGGFSLRLLDQTSTGDYDRLQVVNDEFMEALKKRKELHGLFTFFSANYPQLEITIDNQLAMQKGVSIKTAMDSLAILVASTYEQGFIKFGRFWKLYVQADPKYREMPKNLQELFVGNDKGEMVPFSQFISLKPKQGLNEITRYNAYPAPSIQGAPAAGYSSGDAIRAIQEVAEKTLPRGYDIGWAGLAFDEVGRGNEAVEIFIVVLMFVYLVLVGQYESFLLPLAVILSLPIGVMGSFVLLNSFGLDNDIFAQVGLIMLVGLLGKNAILIVEFAAQKHQQGLSVRDAAIEGARVRFRPILMTSFAFIAGMIPLLRASGAGAIANKTIGASAAGGMLLGTVVGLLVIPGLYYLFATLADRRKLLPDEHNMPLSEPDNENGGKEKPEPLDSP